jgi:cellulose biosynthesis protein BcsQ
LARWSISPTRRRTTGSQALRDLLAEFSETSDFIVIDKPGHDGYLMRLENLLAAMRLTGSGEGLDQQGRDAA